MYRKKIQWDILKQMTDDEMIRIFNTGESYGDKSVEKVLKLYKSSYKMFIESNDTNHSMYKDFSIPGEKLSDYNIPTKFHNTYLTPHKAAKIFNTSAVFLIELLEKGKLPFYQIDGIPLLGGKDIPIYKRAIDSARIEALIELSAQTQALNLE